MSQDARIYPPPLNAGVSVADYGDETATPGALVLPDGGATLRRYDESAAAVRFGPIFRLEPPDIDDYATVDPTGLSTFASDGDGMFITGAAAAGESVCLAHRPVSGSWSYTAQVRGVVPGSTGSYGIAARGANGRLSGITLHANGQVIASRYTSPTVFAAGTPAHGAMAQQPEWLRITYDGTSLRLYYSVHPRASWVLLNTEASASFLLGTPTGVGPLINPKSSAAPGLLWVPSAQLA